MWKFIPLLLLTASRNPLPNMAGVGHAAGGLDATTAAIYFMAVLLVSLLAERMLAAWRSGAAANRLALTIDKLREGIASMEAQQMASMAVLHSELAHARTERTLIRDTLLARNANLDERVTSRNKNVDKAMDNLSVEHARVEDLLKKPMP